MLLNKIRGTSTAKPNRVESQEDLYKRMRAAIERIEAAYDPSISFGGYAEVRKQELDEMALTTANDIARWESGWLELIRDAKRHTKVAKEARNAV